LAWPSLKHYLIRGYQCQTCRKPSDPTKVASNPVFDLATRGRRRGDGSELGIATLHSGMRSESFLGRSWSSCCKIVFAIPRSRSPRNFLSAGGQTRLFRTPAKTPRILFSTPKASVDEFEEPAEIKILKTFRPHRRDKQWTGRQPPKHLSIRDFPI
jgi:hypothetical protein